MLVVFKVVESLVRYLELVQVKHVCTPPIPKLSGSFQQGITRVLLDQYHKCSSLTKETEIEESSYMSCKWLILIDPQHHMVSEAFLSLGLTESPNPNHNACWTFKGLSFFLNKCSSDCCRSLQFIFRVLKRMVRNFFVSVLIVFMNKQSLRGPYSTPPLILIIFCAKNKQVLSFQNLFKCLTLTVTSLTYFSSQEELHMPLMVCLLQSLCLATFGSECYILFIPGSICSQ